MPGTGDYEFAGPERDRSPEIVRLIQLYESRKDLQQKYPEAAFGDLRNLIQWAAQTATKSGENPDTTILKPYAASYVQRAYQRELDSRMHELEAARGQFEAMHARILQLEDSKSKLESTLQTRTTEVRELREERDLIVSRLQYAQAELDDIRTSFGFRFIRLYGGALDRLLPDDTKRGEIRQMAVYGARMIVRRGLRNFLRVAWRRMTTRSLMVQPVLGPTPDSPLTVIAPEKSTKTTASPDAVLVRCDRPMLSVEPARVSDCFIVEGWAIARIGISDVKVFLDDKFQGSASIGVHRPDVALAFPAFPSAEYSGFRKVINLRVDAARRGRHSLKIVAESHDHISASIEGILECAPITPIRAVNHGEDQEGVKGKPSIVIPTRNPPADFEHALQRLADQEGIGNPEIIIMNSGREDISHLAEKYRARVFNLHPEEFDHARVRNYGAENSTGDYVFFMTDDAIPASRYLLRDMISVLKSDKTIAGVTARQIPRSDADLMACQAISQHYRLLRLERDRVVGSSNINSLIPSLKRGLCQIDNVCSCFRREILLEHKFATGQRYAEDLELGIRLIRLGLKIGQLLSVGVIHSHNRPPSHHLKRMYVDVKTLSKLLGSETDRLEPPIITTLDRLLDAIYDLCDRIYIATDHLGGSEFHKGGINAIFDTIQEQLRDNAVSAAGLRSPDQNLSSILEEMSRIAGHTRCRKNEPNPLCQRFQLSAEASEQWLKETYGTLDGMEQQLSDLLFKLLGAEIGRYLAEFYLYCSLNQRTRGSVNRLDRFLSEGI